MFRRFFILISLYLFSISNSFAAMVTFNQSVTVPASIDAQISGIHFNKDGTKMFTVYMKRITADDSINTRFIHEYNLSKPFDISTRAYAGDNERCTLTGTTNNVNYYIHDLEFSSDGMKLIVTQTRQSNLSGGPDQVHIFNLASPYDVSSCVIFKTHNNLDFYKVTHGSKAGNYSGGTAQRRYHSLQGVEISNDGTKLFLLFADRFNAIMADPKVDGVGDITARLYEYNLDSPYDINSLSLLNDPSQELVMNAGIPLPDTLFGANYPKGMRFSPDGKRIFFIAHDNTSSTNSVPGISQVSLEKPFDTSSYTLDGGVDLSGLSTSNDAASGIAFSEDGLKLYIGDDNGTGTD